MGNHSSSQTSSSSSKHKPQTTFSSLKSIKLNSLLSKTSFASIFEAFDQVNKNDFCIAILNFTHNLNEQRISNYQYLSSLMEIDHPSVVEIYSYTTLKREVNNIGSQKEILIMEKFDLCLKDLFEVSLSPYVEKEFACHQSSHNLKTTKDSDNSRASFSNNNFHENDILNMIYSMSDALIYCYSKGFEVTISEKSIFVCKTQEKFLFSPLPLVEDQMSVFNIQSELNKNSDGEKEDTKLKKDLALKREIFHLGVIALKMASLYDFGNDLKTVKQILLDVQNQYPALGEVLSEILIEIFNNNYDVKSLFKRSFYNKVDWKFYSKHLKNETTEKKEKFLEEPFSYKSYQDIILGYNELQCYESSLQILQNLSLDYMSRDQTSLQQKAELADIFEKIGEAYIELKQKDQASDYLVRSINLKETFRFEHFLEMGQANCEIALLFERNEEYTKAVEYLLKASDDYDKHFKGEEDANFLYEKQIEIHLHLLRLKALAFGENDLSLIDSLEKISQSYQNLGDLGSAIKYRTKLKDFCKDHLGKKNATIINNMYKIGKLHFCSGNNKEALKFFNMSLGLTQSVYGKNCAKYVKTFNRIGQVYKEKGDFKTAIKHFEQALKMNQELFGSCHKKTLNIMVNLAKCFEKKGFEEKAISYYEHVLQNLKGKKMEETCQYSKICFRLAKLIERNKKDSHASIEYYRKSLNLFDSNNSESLLSYRKEISP